jgi:hypothetical protein
MHSINNEFLHLKELARQNRLLFSKHFSVVRKNERHITNDEVKWAIVSGLIFEDENAYKAVYKFADRYLSAVFHVTPSGEQLFVRTAYVPDASSWDADSYKNWIRQMKH